MIRRHRRAITTTGADGSATGSAAIQLGDPLRIEAVRLDYSDDQAATTDVVIEDDDGGPILTRSNSAADGWFYPRVPASEPDASASALTEVAPVARRVDVAVAQGNDDETVAVTIFTSD